MGKKVHRFGRSLTAAALAVAGTLGGCGGGDNPSDSTDNVATYPVAGLITTLFTTENNMLYNGFLDPATRGGYGFTTSLKPLTGTTTFEGATVKSSAVTTSVDHNGRIVDTSVALVYYTTDPLVWVGMIDAQGVYSVHTQQAALPATAPAGSKGAWLKSTDYTSAAKSTVKQTTLVSWSVNPSDKAGSAWVCLNFTVETAAPVSNASCILTNSTGQALAYRRNGAAAL
jgi:hypothetical protein